MDRIWLKHYPPGVPAEIDVAQYPSLAAMLEQSFAKFRDATACICMGKSLSYGEVDVKSRALGAWLQSKGLQRGARVAIMMPNVLSYPVAIAAVLRAGFAVVNVNPLYRPRELEFQLRDSGAEAIVVLENFAATLQQVVDRTDVKHVVMATMGDLMGALKGTIVNLMVRHVKKLVQPYALPASTFFSDALAAGRKLTLTDPDLGPDDIAFLQYTGGTTGDAKGAVLTHRNLIANTLQVDAWQKPMLARLPHVDRLVVLTALPLYHIFALTVCFLVGSHTGACCLLIPDPRNIANLVKQLRKLPVNSLPAVNTLFNALLHHPDIEKIDWSGLKSAIGGGMAVQKSVAARWVEATGCPIIEGYGLSETSPVLTCNRGDTAEWDGTIGLPMPSTEISIRGDDGNEVGVGTPGEICARGPQVMAGYWQRPEETARVMTEDGFFRTGDIGVMDARGQIRIVDRKKDMIVVSGFKVFPNEVEDVIAHHPGVRECAVIGVPDAHAGEAVKLFVVKRDPNLTQHELKNYCHAELVAYKVPKIIEFIDELPKTNIGKILRRALREESEKPKSAAA